ncbi:MAG: hypothetical protein CM1200mP7_1200 [Chloroflexota bacterium]|nr:MAG: hypothetical protein CM1200mP7_1200 [Chloroflexota bacterium]
MKFLFGSDRFQENTSCNSTGSLFFEFFPYAIELLHLEDDDGDGIPNIIDGRKVGSTF